MVLKYAKNGVTWHEPPYTKAEIAAIEAKGFYAAPIGITHAHARGEAPVRPKTPPPPPAKARRGRRQA
jgi:hypothetical protein